METDTDRKADVSRQHVLRLPKIASTPIGGGLETRVSGGDGTFFECSSHRISGAGQQSPHLAVFEQTLRFIHEDRTRVQAANVVPRQQ